MATKLPVVSGGQPDNYGFNLSHDGQLRRMGAMDNTVNSSATGSTSSNSSGAQNQTQTQNGIEVVDSTTSNMTDANQALLQQLIQQLLGGGTPEMQQQNAVRAAERAQVNNIRGAFTKEAAFGDAQGLISQQQRRVLEQLLPSINRAAEDAGSSGGALRALLLQDAANKAAESASALGVQTATNYGGIAANLSQVMERLTAVDPQATKMLVDALNVSKGAVQNTTGTKTTSGTTNTNTASSQSQSGTSSENKNTTTDYTPLAPVRNTSPLYFGPSAPDNFVSHAGTSTHNMQQLADALSGDSSWSNYAF